MSMEHVQPAGAEAAAAMFAEAVARTGLLTMRDVIRRAGVSYKTISKHRRTGLLKGERRLVFGKLIWLFDPTEVARYATVARSEVASSLTAGRLRGSVTRAQAPAGHMTVADIVSESGRTAWCIYEAIQRGDLAAEPTGLKGAYLVANAAARAWISDYQYLPLLEETATIPDAARRFDVSENTLRAAITAGRIPAHAIGDVRTQASPGSQVGRAIMRVRLDDVREFAQRLVRKRKARP